MKDFNLFCEYLPQFSNIMKIGRKFTDKNLTLTPKIKENLIYFIYLCLNILDDLNKEFPMFPKNKLDLLIEKNKEIKILKEKYTLNLENSKHSRNTGMDQLKKMTEFMNKKEIQELHDSNSFSKLIEIKQLQIDKLELEQKNINNIKNFIKNILIDFHTSSVFINLLEELNSISEESNVISIKIKNEILDSFIYITKIDYSLESYIVVFEKEVLSITKLIDKDATDDYLNEKITYFLLIFFYNSYKLEIFSNFKNLTNGKDSLDFEEKFFSLFETTESEILKLNISLMFVILSLNKWNMLKKICVVKPTVKFLQYYLISRSRSKKVVESNLDKFNLVVKIFSFICDNKNFEIMYHTDFFKNYLNVVLIIYKVNHPSFSQAILQILLKFSYFYDCKVKLVTEYMDIVNIVQERVYNLSSQFYNLGDVFINSTEKLNKFNREIDNNSYSTIHKEKINLEIEWFHIASNKAKGSFIETLKFLEEYNYLLAFLISLTLTNDYENNYEKAFVLKDDKINIKNNNFGKLYRLLEKCEDLFKNKKFIGKILEIEYDDEDEYIQNIKNTLHFIDKFTYQLILIVKIRQPDKNIKDQYGQDFCHFNTFIENINFYLSDHDILHKLLYALNRFVFSIEKNEFFYSDQSKTQIQSFIEMICRIIYSNSSSVIVNREALRLLCSFTMNTDKSLLWCRFDTKNLHLDYANNTDLLLKIKNSNMKFPFFKSSSRLWSGTYRAKDNDKNLSNKKPLFLPYKKIQPYKYEMGVIFYGPHVLTIPKKLFLINNFTITFRLFNPLISTGNFHTLLQSENGISLVTITCDRKKIGCFTSLGEWVESEIDLDNSEYFRKWIQITITYRAEYLDELDNIIKEPQLCFYLNDNLVGSPHIGKFKFENNIKYIGNSKDMNEPFGVFCDLRIFSRYFNDREIKELSSDNDSKNHFSFYIEAKYIKDLIERFLESNDESEETFYYTVKLFNNLLSHNDYKTNFGFTDDNKNLTMNDYINFKSLCVVNKITSRFTTNLLETKKEIVKFLNNIE